MDKNIKFKTVEEYFFSLPENIKPVLETLRKIIKQAAPQAMECISYNMPAFRQNGILVYYAAFKNHISLFPTGSAIIAFKEELLNYKTSKGAIQFALGESIPEDLVEKIVIFRINECSKNHRNNMSAH